MSARSLQKIKNFIATHGNYPSCFFALLPKNNFRLSPNNDYLITYQKSGRVIFIFGDPMGKNTTAISVALSQFVKEIKNQKRLVALYNLTPRHRAVYQKLGFQIMQIGAEAIINVPRFTLAGANKKALRNNIAFVQKQNIMWEWQEADKLSNTAKHGVTKLYTAWIKSQKTAELNNHLFPIPAGTKALILLAKQNNELVGAFSFYPYNPNSIALDLMLRSSTAPRGLVEAALAEAITLFQKEKTKELSIGFAGTISPKRPHTSTEFAEQGLRLVYTHWNKLYNFKELVRFKNKFEPRWEPRYLAYQHAYALGYTMAELIRLLFRRPVWTKLEQNLKDTIATGF